MIRALAFGLALGIAINGAIAFTTFQRLAFERCQHFNTAETCRHILR